MCASIPPCSGVSSPYELLNFPKPLSSHLNPVISQNTSQFLQRGLQYIQVYSFYKVNTLKGYSIRNKSIWRSSMWDYSDLDIFRSEAFWRDLGTSVLLTQKIYNSSRSILSTNWISWSLLERSDMVPSEIWHFSKWRCFSIFSRFLRDLGLLVLLTERVYNTSKSILSTGWISWSPSEKPDMGPSEFWSFLSEGVLVSFWVSISDHLSADIFLSEGVLVFSSGSIWDHLSVDTFLSEGVLVSFWYFSKWTCPSILSIFF